MVKVVPFKGFRYEKDKVNDYKLVVSPPYDVINSELQKKLHEGSEFNIAHIIKGKKFPTDDEEDNEYIRASNLLESWIEEGVLKREKEPTIYVLAQDFVIDGQKMTRAGFIALVELEDMCSSSDSSGTCTGVHQHEEYTDESRTVDQILEDKMRETPLMEVVDDEGITHRLWAISDSEKIQNIQEILESRYIIIADGHHRYKTALRYHKDHPDQSSKYRMLAFVNTANEGLVILPTHRLIQRVEDFDCAKLLISLSQDFDIESFEFQDDDKEARSNMFRRLDEHFTEGKHALGLYCNDGKYYSMVLKNENILDAIPDHSHAWKRLDVTILHKLILEDRLGLDKEKIASGSIKGGSYVEYIKAVGDAVLRSIDKVNNSGYEAVFFMNPTKVKEVEEVATNHETMPQKSTFFYPKVYTGFVVNKL
jgi:uncharacterized protein (DUF1015 family)